MTARRRRRATTTPSELDGRLAAVDGMLGRIRDRLRAGELSRADHDLTFGDVSGGELLRDIDRVFAVGRVRALVRTLGVGLVFTLGLARTRGLAHAFRLDRVRDLARVLDHDHARGLARALARDIDRVHFADGPGAREELAAKVERAHRRVAELRALLSFRPDGAGRPRCRTGLTLSRAAVRLVTLSARALPAEDHARYAEEFQRDLWELSAAGAGRGDQFRYAVRQLIRAPGTRRALKRSRASERTVS